MLPFLEPMIHSFFNRIPPLFFSSSDIIIISHRNFFPPPVPRPPPPPPFRTTVRRPCCFAPLLSGEYCGPRLANIKSASDPGTLDGVAPRTCPFSSWFFFTNFSFYFYRRSSWPVSSSNNCFCCPRTASDVLYACYKSSISLCILASCSSLPLSRFFSPRF